MIINVIYDKCNDKLKYKCNVMKNVIYHNQGNQKFVIFTIKK